ncbi:MAG: aminotransferase class III [Phycisphaeraceae bacterium]|nr:aminotransferase class III [Phycisphaeraceae bacterium]
MQVGQRLYQQAKRLIPGATQLFGKRPELYAPDQWPPYYATALGCQVTDLDGNTYVDMSTGGIGATVLGYSDPDVTHAVIDAIQRGSMCSLNPAQEVELVQLLIDIHPWAQMARLGRMGGESMAMAIRIARARTQRDKVAFCGYHGWHDWYLAANLSVSGDDTVNDRLADYHLMAGLDPAGIPKKLAGTAIPFGYNKIDELKTIVDREGQHLAAIVMEPTRSDEPAPGFLESVRDLANRSGARLVFDEITIGWKLCLGGSHLKYGVEPDIAVFAKSTGNGHPIAAVLGNADTMQAAQNTFISSALWTEAVGPAAGIAAINKFKRVDVPKHIDRIGRAVRDGLAELATENNLPLSFSAHPALTQYRFDHPHQAAIQTLWTVRMLERGFLTAGLFCPMLSHESSHVSAFLNACEPVFFEISQAIKDQSLEQRIGGPVKHTGFTRLA